jgi:hypothetical protein
MCSPKQHHRTRIRPEEEGDRYGKRPVGLWKAEEWKSEKIDEFENLGGNTRFDKRQISHSFSAAYRYGDKGGSPIAESLKNYLCNEA